MAKTHDSKKFMGLLGQYQFFVIFYEKKGRKSRNFSGACLATAITVTYQWIRLSC